MYIDIITIIISNTLYCLIIGTYILRLHSELKTVKNSTRLIW